MLKLVKEWDRKLEKVINEVDKIVERVNPVNTEDKTRLTPQAKRIS